MYIGFVITIQEAIRLFKLNKNIVSSFYDTEPIQAYLREKNNDLQFKYIDKGAYVLGIPVNTEDNTTCFPYANLEDTFYAMIHAKYIFEREIRNLAVDMSVVNITWIESEEVCVEHPQPYVIHFQGF